jgi:hypothetical protein
MQHRGVSNRCCIRNDFRFERMKRKPGQQPKGDRAAITARVPRSHYERYVAEARSAGLSLSDYITVVLAEHFELAVPDYVHRTRGQEELPISA